MLKIQAFFSSDLRLRPEGERIEYPSAAGIRAGTFA